MTGGHGHIKIHGYMTLIRVHSTMHHNVVSCMKCERLLYHSWERKSEKSEKSDGLHHQSMQHYAIVCTRV